MRTHCHYDSKNTGIGAAPGRFAPGQGAWASDARAAPKLAKKFRRYFLGRYPPANTYNGRSTSRYQIHPIRTMASGRANK